MNMFINIKIFPAALNALVNEYVSGMMLYDILLSERENRSSCCFDEFRPDVTEYDYTAPLQDGFTRDVEFYLDINVEFFANCFDKELEDFKPTRVVSDWMLGNWCIDKRTAEACFKIFMRPLRIEIRHQRADLGCEAPTVLDYLTKQSFSGRASKAANWDYCLDAKLKNLLVKMIGYALGD
jgi:hypothetical protein